MTERRQFRIIKSNDCGYISLDDICEEYNILIYSVDFNKIPEQQNCEGIIYFSKKENTYNIIVQENLNIFRKRYAIAVQLGHFFLGHVNKNEIIDLFDKNIMYDEKKASDIRLKESIIFAKELLMPEKDFRHECSRGICLFLSLISDTFKVSKLAVKNRCLELGLNEFYD